MKTKAALTLFVLIIVFLFLIPIVFLSCKEEQGPAGSTSLINVAEEPAGNNCPAGGQRIETGIDKNSNSTLESSEILATEYVCNGIEGTDGANGLETLVIITTETAGTAPDCVNGGIKLEFGTDTNDNNVLDADEITSTRYVCNGNNGADGHSTVFAVKDENPGQNCAAGGYKIESGLDINDNLVLDDFEVQTTEYLCNGQSFYQKEIRLYFPLDGQMILNTNNGLTELLQGQFLEFDRTDYPQIDSITFTANFRTTERDSGGYLQLFNVTDSRIVTWSVLQSNSVGYSTSADFTNDLPGNNITLGIMFWSDAATDIYIERAYVSVYVK